jgi:ATP-dependent Clp protease ATP-binding subunit ClpX
MYDLPGLTGIESILVNKEVVEGRAKPLYVHAERRSEAPGA